jgi:hypothetical protein
MDAQLKYDPTATYVPVVLDEALLPLGPTTCGGSALGGGYYWKERNLLPIDWLFVEPVGIALPPGRTLIGISNGYMVSTTCYKNFAEFVLAVREATLQSPLIEKVGAPAPPVVQTTTGQ